MLSVQMEAWGYAEGKCACLQASKWQCVWEYENAAEPIPLGVPLPACKSPVRQWGNYTAASAAGRQQDFSGYDPMPCNSPCGWPHCMLGNVVLTTSWPDLM